MKSYIASLMFISFLICLSGTQATSSDYELKWINQTEGWAKKVAISGNGNYVAVGSDDYRVYLFDKKGKLLWKYKSTGIINSVSISADGSFVVAGSTDSSLYFLNKAGTARWSSDLGAKEVSITEISQDGKYIAAASENKIFFLKNNGVILWSFETGDDIEGISVSSNGTHLAAASLDGNLYFFDRNGGLWSNDPRGMALSSVSISQDGSQIIGATIYNHVFLMDKFGVVDQEFTIDGTIKEISFIKNSSEIAVLTQDYVLHIFSLSGTILASLEFGDSFESLSVSDDGKNIITGSPHPERNLYFYQEIVKEPVEEPLDPEPEPIVEIPTPTPPPPPKPVVILVANRIDHDLSGDIVEFLGEKGFDVLHSDAGEFKDRYWWEKKIIVLGGPDAFEQIGGVVRQVLKEDEQQLIRTPGSKYMIAKSDVWSLNQKVIVIAGSNRHLTKEAQIENKEQIITELGY